MFWASLGTAIACGLGAVPFIRKKSLDKKRLGYANAVAASMMIAASFDLIYQGIALKDTTANTLHVLFGIIIGLIFILIAHKRADKHSGIRLNGHKIINRKNAFLIIIVMTMHSGAEGIAMGVAQGTSSSLGLFILIVMAIQNIPEGLAISLQLVKKGTPWRKAGLRSIATSLPQPLLAVPAYYFVSIFQPIVPWGLGFAAGCMIRMCFGGITKESYDGTDPLRVGIIATFSIVIMLLLQIVIL